MSQTQNQSRKYACTEHGHYFEHTAPVSSRQSSAGSLAGVTGCSQPMGWTALCMAALVMLSSCSATPRSTTPDNPFAAYAETDFALIDDEQYTAASLQLAAHVDVVLSALPGARSYGVRDIIAVADGGYILLAVEPAADGEQLIAVRAAASGTPLSTETLLFASGTQITDVVPAVIEDVSVEVLEIHTGSSPGIDTVYVAWFPAGLAVLRAELDGAVANYALRAVHPQLPTLRGRLAGPSRAEMLAALVHLAAADQAEERSSAAVLGHIQALAGGTDTWATQAAADLLTR